MIKRCALALIITFATLPLLGQKAVPCVNHYVTYSKLTQHQFDAMVDFTFNVGCGAFRESTLLKRINRGDVIGAANEFPKWNKAGGVVLRGLVKRRADERRLFLQP